MNQGKKEDKIYFQFNKSLQFPIFIQITKGAFHNHFQETLKECGFEELQKKEELEAMEKTIKRPNARILQMKEASPKVSLQIGKLREADFYGPESIIPQSHYKIYRYQGLALLIYSFSFKEWELGGIENLGRKEESFALKTILIRYLSWCLAPLGVVGFWGRISEKKILLLKQSESSGDIVWIDIKNSKIICQDKIEKIPIPLFFLRPDQSLNRRDQKMSKEELYSFLMERTSYFDYPGPIVSIRQMILELSQMAVGTLCNIGQVTNKADLVY